MRSPQGRDGRGAVVLRAQHAAVLPGHARRVPALLGKTGARRCAHNALNLLHSRKSINSHWNQSGTHADFGIADPTSVGQAGAAALGALTSPLGTAAGGIVGCVIGGIRGYHGGSVVAGDVYDWAESTRTTALPEASAP